VPLLLVDLDNTLIDRTGAFRRWARAFSARHGRGEQDERWLETADRDGFESRERLAAMMTEHFGPGNWDQAALLAELRAGIVRHLVVDQQVIEALRAARAAGWTPFVITNGNVPQQERKLRHTGLDAEIAGWVISEGVGIKKPAPEIFRLAAARAGLPLNGAWMIGDSAEADIAGARNAGIPAIWLHRDRPWPLAGFAPEHSAGSFPAAVSFLLARA
jgi:putative hydrolase of the HAD superfamily